MGIAIDFVQAARRLRPPVEKKVNKITESFKADARLALVEMDSKPKTWEELINLLDRSGHDVRALDAQLFHLKSLMGTAGAKLDAL
jgi:hypothetical protein